MLNGNKNSLKPGRYTGLLNFLLTLSISGHNALQTRKRDPPWKLCAENIL